MFSCAINPSATPQSAKSKIDLDIPSDNITAFLKMRGNTDGADTVMWWSGQIFAVIPQEKPALLFEFEGINVARLVHQPDGSWRMLTLGEQQKQVDGQGDIQDPEAQIFGLV